MGVLPGIHGFRGRFLQIAERPSYGDVREWLLIVTQDTHVKINSLREQDWTLGEIAEVTGFLLETISNFLHPGGPSVNSQFADDLW